MPKLRVQRKKAPGGQNRLFVTRGRNEHSRGAVSALKGGKAITIRGDTSYSAEAIHYDVDQLDWLIQALTALKEELGK